MRVVGPVKDVWEFSDLWAFRNKLEEEVSDTYWDTFLNWSGHDGTTLGKAWASYRGRMKLIDLLEISRFCGMVAPVLQYSDAKPFPKHSSRCRPRR